MRIKPCFRHLFILAPLILLAACIPSKTILFTGPLLEQWMETDPDQLRSQINSLATQADLLHADALAACEYHAPTALVLPHAGYAYSGTIAALGYRAASLRQKPYTRIILLAPSHRRSYAGIHLLPATHYHTPLGDIKLTLPVLQSNSSFIIKSDAHSFEKEHSAHMHIPLIQSLMPNATLIPLMVGSLTPEQARACARILASLITPDTLVVISSDFTHYGTAFNYTPFTTNIQSTIAALDARAFALIATKTLDEWFAFKQETGATLCGFYPLSILIALRELQVWGPVGLGVLAYDTSGRMTKNDAHSVSYAALALTPLQFSKDERHNLLARAHTALTAAVNKFDHTPASTKNPFLRQPLGLFATLTDAQGTLRGCVGRITTDQPLISTVATVAADAALHDSRFPRVTPEELSTLTLSLSILTPPYPLSNLDDFELGTHGIILSVDGARALFLPEVATQQGWDRDTMLANLSRKAGLAANAWQSPDAQFSVFTSVKVSELA